MESVFLHLLNMSITAGWLVLAVLLLRLVFRKAPKWIHCLLWVMVAVRLICPFSIESVLSLIPSTETVPVDTFLYETPAIHSGVPVVDNAVNPIISENLAPEPRDSVNPTQILTWIAANVWVLGMLAMAVYAVVSTLRLRWRVRESACLQRNIWQCDRIATPFILGIIRPRIYLPTTLTLEDTLSVVAHEEAHIRRRDHWWKPLGFLLLTVYWFNPLMWVGYIFLCRDIEAACDERVVRDMDVTQRKNYSDALLACSAPRRLVTACPLAFGETGVKSRIKSVLNYKKPAFWVIIVSVIAVIVAAVCLLTNPKTTVEDDLDAFLSQTILEQNHSEHTGDAFVTEAHTVFGTEKKDGNTVVYGLVLYEEYIQTENGDLEVQSASHIPTVITVGEKDGGYTLVEYWVPRDGDLYAPDIREKYPARYQSQAFDVTGYYDGHHAKTLSAARAHFVLTELPSDIEYTVYSYAGPPSAQLYLELDGNRCEFTPSILSSWIGVGTYAVDGQTVTLTFEDMKLVFNGDYLALTFDKAASQYTPEQLTFGGQELEDGARFTRVVERDAVTVTNPQTFSNMRWMSESKREKLYENVPTDSSDEHLPILTIASREELDAFIEEYKSELDLNSAVEDRLTPIDQLSLYNDEFFAHNVLLAVYYRDSSCSVAPQIVGLEYQDTGTTLVALVDVYEPYAQNQALGQWFMLCEVDYAAIENVSRYYAVVRGHIPSDVYVAAYTDPAIDPKTATEKWRDRLNDEEHGYLRRLADRLVWKDAAAYDHELQFTGCYHLEGTLYYVSSGYEVVWNGQQFAVLNEEDKAFFSALFMERGASLTTPYPIPDTPDEQSENTFVGKVTQVAGGSMLMECYDTGKFTTVWVSLQNFPDLNPKVGEEYVITHSGEVMEIFPPQVTAVAITPVSSTPTVNHQNKWSTGEPLYDALLDNIVAEYPWNDRTNGAIFPNYPELSDLYYNMDLSDVGYALVDIDKNGQKELLLGGDNYPFPYDGFTIINGKLVHLFRSHERNSYTILKNGYIQNVWSGSAAMSGTDYYRLVDGKMQFLERVTYDAFYAENTGAIDSLTDANAENCFYHSTIYNDGDSYKGYQSVSLEEVGDIQDKYSKQQELQIQYIPLKNS